MAKIINRSSYSIELFGQDGPNDKRWIIPGRDPIMNSAWQTASTFDCVALRGAEGVDVFGSSDWWEVLTQEVHVYDWQSNSVTLHCIPIRPGAAHQPSLPGYRLLADPDTTITVDLDPELRIMQSAPARNPKDGEINSSHELYGKFVRTGSNISVRVRAIRSNGATDDDLEHQLPIWKEKIERIWSGASSSANTTLNIECDWVDHTAHFTIFVSPQVPRPFMFSWSLSMDDIPDDPQGEDQLITSVHEFGHFLGLTDGYIRDGELPWLRDFIYKTPALKGAPTAYGPITLAASLIPILENKARANDRIQRACPAGHFDIMQYQNVLVGGKPTANPTIPAVLIDTIAATVDASQGEHQTQPLCWRKELFFD